ncbi:hypothetical protein CALCODRAFT_505095 [Calocera cornea HHB12733]|uniref:Uncharacterized protein n=1 Tax=Calocera cornea HHB12733 TaxID=1353952 RepID=A0A165C0Q1_9BASI|nr:hypothetical protein CALCODRAFT_505095 [Calocera cornea HHB12733]
MYRDDRLDDALDGLWKKCFHSLSALTDPVRHTALCESLFVAFSAPDGHWYAFVLFNLSAMLAPSTPTLLPHASNPPQVLVLDGRGDRHDSEWPRLISCLGRCAAIPDDDLVKPEDVQVLHIKCPSPRAETDRSLCPGEWFQVIGERRLEVDRLAKTVPEGDLRWARLFHLKSLGSKRTRLSDVIKQLTFAADLGLPRGTVLTDPRPYRSNVFFGASCGRQEDSSPGRRGSTPTVHSPAPDTAEPSSLSPQTSPRQSTHTKQPHNPDENDSPHGSPTDPIASMPCTFDRPNDAVAEGGGVDPITLPTASQGLQQSESGVCTSTDVNVSRGTMPKVEIPGDSQHSMESGLGESTGVASPLQGPSEAFYPFHAWQL